MAHINHLAIVVENIQTALGFWRDALGLPLGQVQRNEAEEVEIAFLPLAEGEIELLAPINDTSGVAKYLAKRGPGMHHICLEVDNLEEMLADMKAKGVKLINETPTSGAGGKKIAFIHPSSANGVLVELYQNA
jgi:methylmalonyl-CoA/ethylmalonyl-CoA epimerase